MIENVISKRYAKALSGSIKDEGELQVGDQVADPTIKNRLAILKRTIEKEEVA